MGTVITNLKARFGVDSSDFKKGLKDGEKAIDEFKGAASSKFEEFASMFGINMRAVSDSVNSAQKSLNYFAQSFAAAASGGNKLTIALHAVKSAIVATGFGAIIVALGSIIAYFSKTGEGADKFARILSQVKSVVDNVIDRLATFGKGLWEIMTGRFREGWETMKNAFKGIGEEIKNDWKAAGELADREDVLEDKEIALINSLEERRAKAAELRLMAKEEIEDNHKKLSLLNEAERIIKSVYADEISLEKERLAIMKERLAMQASDPTDEQRREIAEQEAKINSLIRQQAEELRALQRERTAALKIVREEAELQRLKAQAAQLATKQIAEIKIPDIAPAINVTLKQLHEAQAQVQAIMVDITQAITGAFEQLMVGLGEFIGALMTGDAGVKDFAKLIASSFGDLAVTVGKITIQAALAVAGIEKALRMPGAWPMALAAGVALVALGSAVRGAFANAASGGQAGINTTAQTGTYNYDTRSNPVTVEVKITGELRGQGRELVAVINEENLRKNIVT